MSWDDCEKCEELLQPYLDRVLSDAERAEADRHLEGCSYCRKRYVFEDQIRQFVRQSVLEEMPPELKQKLAPLRTPLSLRAARRGSAGRAGRARDHDQPSRVAAPGQRADGAATELGRKPAGQRLSAGLEVDDRLLVAEAVRLRDVADAIAERADVRRDLARVVDVAAAVEEVDGDLPRSREQCGRLARLRRPVPEADEDRGQERRDERGGGAAGEPAPKPARRRRLDGEAGQAPGLAVVDPERGRVAKKREDGGLAVREAVEAALLEPLDLVRPERGALGGLLDRQLPLQAQPGQHGRLVGRRGI